MTFSADARRRNMNNAFVRLLEALDDEWFGSFDICPADYPDVLPTTWTELTNEGFLKDMDLNVVMYRFTRSGYIAALRRSGRSDEQQFREKLGRVCKVLKSRLEDRTQSALISLQDLLNESCVSEAFACNVLGADLIRHILGRRGAQWDGNQVVKVPPDFGLTPI